MARLGAALALLLIGCGTEAPPDAPPAATEWVVVELDTLVADSLRLADVHVAWAADLDRRSTLYEDELDSLIDGRGPARYSSRDMERLVDDVRSGRFKGLYGNSGPVAEADWDFDGDGRDDRLLASTYVPGETGAIYLQNADGSFDLAGAAFVGQIFRACPNGDGTATVLTFSARGANLTGSGQTLRVQRGKIETLEDDVFGGLYDDEGTIVDAEMQRCERRFRAVREVRSGCTTGGVLSSSFQRDDSPCGRR